MEFQHTNDYKQLDRDQRDVEKMATAGGNNARTATETNNAPRVRGDDTTAAQVQDGVGSETDSTGTQTDSGVGEVEAGSVAFVNGQAVQVNRAKPAVTVKKRKARGGKTKFSKAPRDAGENAPTVAQGSTPLTRTLQKSPIMGSKECSYVEEKKV